MNKYSNYITTHLGQIHNGDEHDYILMSKYFSKNYLKFLPDERKSRILDLGCGMGHFLYFLKIRGYIDYIGVDISEECIKYCKKKHLAKNSQLHCKDALNFLLKEETNFDIIIMNDLIEHISKKQIPELLILIRKKLKNDGKLIVKTINCANPIMGASSRYLDFTHLVGFTEESLSQVLKMAGFDQVDIYPQNIWVFNFLINCLGKIAQSFLSFMFRILFLFSGRRSTKIFTKDIIAIASD